MSEPKVTRKPPYGSEAILEEKTNKQKRAIVNEELTKQERAIIKETPKI